MPEGELLFRSPDGGPLRSSNFHRRVWAPAREAVNQPGLRIHDLRHTAASLAVDSGANVKAVQQMLGHASAEMTLDRYAGLFDGHLDDVARRMEAQFSDEKSDSEVTEGAEVMRLTRHSARKVLDTSDVSLVAPRGFEPPTQGLGNLCSIP